MAAIRIGINGFGRIGRLIFRAMLDDPDFDVVFINELAPLETLAPLLQNDSVHGRLSKSVTHDDHFIYTDHKRTQVLKENDPKHIPYSELAVDFIIESTGVFTTLEKAKGHHAGGATGRVLITAPSKDAPMYVVGVNHEEFNPETDQIISAASCTTNCLAPLAKVLHDQFGIVEGLMSTIHAVTAGQKVVDVAGARDVRASRGILNNIIVSSTGAAKAVGKVMKDLEGKLTGTAFRVPIPDVSVVDLTVRLEKSTNLNEISSQMKEASETYLSGILGYTEEPVVSTDFIGCPLSSVYDKTASIELNSYFYKLVAWYDNEWGYANRCVDLIRYCHVKGG